MGDCAQQSLAPRPKHVPEVRVFGFDFYNIPGAPEDVQSAYHSIPQSARDIILVPRLSSVRAARLTHRLLDY